MRSAGNVTVNEVNPRTIYVTSVKRRSPLLLLLLLPRGTRRACGLKRIENEDRAANKKLYMLFEFLKY